MLILNSTFLEGIHHNFQIRKVSRPEDRRPRLVTVLSPDKCDVSRLKCTLLYSYPREQFIWQTIICLTVPILPFSLFYILTNSGRVRRAICKLAGAKFKLYIGRSKFTVKVTCFRSMVSLERYGHKEHMSNMITHFLTVRKLWPLFSLSRSNVTVKVTCSKLMVPSEKPCNKEHTCQIRKPYLLG